MKAAVPSAPGVGGVGVGRLRHQDGGQATDDRRRGSFMLPIRRRHKDAFRAGIFGKLASKVSDSRSLIAEPAHVA